ncbi:MAG TPA: hypothetical protein VET65_10645 [Candidatus Limnocylindrales bacterium]|nr:hypothetical protein [Candidatus Limnocylindrales bacterium]
MFKRVSLTGSGELFRETKGITDPILEEESPTASPSSEPVRLHQLPPRALGTPQYTYGLTEVQVQTLIDALQKVKYPHTLRSVRPSMEEFERLEALRQVLLDGLR